MKVKLFVTFACLLLTTITFAQGDVLEEYFYASGKIKVVIVVAGIVMLGLLAYVFSLDRKVKKLENRIDKKK